MTDRMDPAEADRTPACACRRPSRPGEHSEIHCRVETTWGALTGRVPGTDSPLLTAGLAADFPAEPTDDEVWALRAAAAQARRNLAHLDERGAPLDATRHWRATATWLDRRAAAIERGEDPARVVDDPDGEMGTVADDVGLSDTNRHDTPPAPVPADLDTLVSWVETALDSSDIEVTVRESDGSVSPLRRLVRCLRSAGLLNEDAGDAAETSTEWGVRRDRTGQVNNCGLGGEAFARRTAVCIVSEPVTVVHREVGPWLRAAGTAVPPGQEG